MSVLNAPATAEVATQREPNQQPPERGLARVSASWQPTRSASVAEIDTPDEIQSGDWPPTFAERTPGHGPVGMPATHDTDADWLQLIAKVPAALFPAPGRLLRSADLDATGFADREADTVGVDLARWRTPPSDAVDDHAWRRIFNWLVVADHELARIAVLTPPAPRGDGYTASYGYEAGGVGGIGVLSVAPLPGGEWRIVDCWGDACHAERVRELAAEFV